MSATEFYQRDAKRKTIIASFPGITSSSLIFNPSIIPRYSSYLSPRFSHRFHCKYRVLVNLNYIYIIYCLTVNSSPLFRWDRTKVLSFCIFFCFLYNFIGFAKPILSKTIGLLILLTFSFSSFFFIVLNCANLLYL